ncbi:MAG: glycosyl hydrolase 2 galactose-binding domain-containing protein [Streptosporangiaceae bacterium]
MSGSRSSIFLRTGSVAAVLAVAISLPVSRTQDARAAVASASAASVSSPDVGTTTLGLGGWQVQASTKAPQSGTDISAPGFSTSGWLQVKPDDAGAPGTEIEALVQNGACPDVFFSDNLRKCFGFTTDAGAVTTPPFNVPWWYRTDFNSNLGPGQHATLIVNGVVGQADAWVNGQEVATQDVIQGAYARYSFDVTGLLRSGTNTLALEVYPNDPSKMFTLDNVDWTQIPPDNNTGIQFPVQLQVSDAVALNNAHVTQNDAADLSTSALTVKADVTNNTATAQTATVKAVVTPPNGGGGAISVQQSVTVPASQTTTVTFTPAGYPNLTINHPQLWWPYQMGGQPLYTLGTQLLAGGTLVNSSTEQFGIRTITSRLIGPGPNAPGGVRQFLVNGQPIVIRGGGFDPNLLLHYSSQDIANQIELMKGMGLNAIRLEGHLMPDDFYTQLDKAGILNDAGFQCCDAWQVGRRTVLTDKQLDVLYRSALRIGQDLRNHPSTLNMSWSDNQPRPAQEVQSLKGFADADFQDPIIASAEYKSTPTLGLSGEKEGPYDWVPPSYWYDTTHSDFADDSSLTNVGGSWGFDSEQSAGDTVPTLDSIRRFLSTDEQTQLWTNPGYNQYHANWETDTSGYSFGTLYNFDTALTNRYGSWSSLGQYVQEAQVADYENVRSQFEAFIDHSTNSASPSTGTIYWQMNKGWPSLLWNLYNSDYDQAGSYFGAQKANEGIHALFATDTNQVALDNLTGKTQAGLSVEAKVYGIDGTLLDDQVSGTLKLGSQEVRNDVLAPNVPATTAPPEPAKTYFVELVLRKGDTVIDRNVYWQSTQQDVVDWDATMGNPQATMSQYADLTALQNLKTASVTASQVSHPAPGGQEKTVVTITNTSDTPTVAFFLRADVRRGNADGSEQAGDNQVLPIVWSDNDITLWPGESETVTATYDASQLQGATPVVSLYGWNIGRTDIPATVQG